MGMRRTTFRIDEEILAEAKALAARQHRSLNPVMEEALRRVLYPLGYWETVAPAARARGIDPLLVMALIRQESLFDPDAVSPDDIEKPAQDASKADREDTKE